MRTGKFRSKFEADFADWLLKQGIPFEYESYQLEYWVDKAARGTLLACMDCGCNNIKQRGWYKPDFYLPNQDIFIETKGRFKPEDQRKMIAMKEYHPDVDIKMLFMDNRVIDKRTGFRHLDWCEKYGYDGAIKEVPDKWLQV